MLLDMHIFRCQITFFMKLRERNQCQWNGIASSMNCNRIEMLQHSQTGDAHCSNELYFKQYIPKLSHYFHVCIQTVFLFRIPFQWHSNISILFQRSQFLSLSSIFIFAMFYSLFHGNCCNLMLLIASFSKVSN